MIKTVKILIPHGVRSGMASLQLQLQPPERFDFKSPDGWLKWKWRYEQYCEAAGLTGESQARQVSTLLYCLGEEANGVLTSTNVTADERKSYAAVIAKFDTFFQVRRNTIFERSRFNQRIQLVGESAEKFISALYSLAEHCNYGDLKDQMIRDRLVVGILDKKLSQTLQLDANLTLEKAKTTIRQKEAVKEQGQELEGCKPKQKSLEELKLQVAELELKLQSSKKQGYHHGPPRPHKPQFPRRGGAGGRSCSRCGYAQHQRGERCPAAEATCRWCRNVGHYENQCFFRKKTPVASMDAQPMASLDADFLDTVNSFDRAAWTAAVLLDDTEVHFKLDTGAGVTAISEETFKTLKCSNLKEASRKLFGPAKQELEVLGQFTARLTHQRDSSNEEVYVIRGLKTDLLGLPAISSLHLVKRLCETEPAEPDARTQEIQKQFPKVFNGLGTMGEEYVVKLKEESHPYAIYAPRNVPIPLRPKVQEELNRMEEIGVIQKVSQPTPWCAGMVVVPKKSGSIRICVDLKPLNDSVLREVYPIPKVDDILAQLAGAKVFSKLDANSGFWQIPLAEKSKHLTTFLTPFGRYCFNKLPFGISSAPEVYQKRMNQILEGLPGVVCLIDDVLIYGKDQEEHDARLAAALKRLEDHNVTLNRDKCKFNQRSIKFLGHLIDQDGVRADPDKTAAIRDMDTPKSITDLRRFMGMVNQLGKFTPRTTDLSQPLRDLLSTKNAWVWGPEQDRAFMLVKEELVKPTVLALYDPTANTKISADASSFGLGAVLLQQHRGEWQPVAYASRVMSETERRYAQIEKEALATTWACEKFSDYILGLPFSVESDHKPLIPLLNTKCLNGLPPRILRFRLRLARFRYTIHHVPGKLLYTVDTLSRAPADQAPKLVDEIEIYIHEVVMPALPAGPSRLDAYRSAQAKDPVCGLIMEYCRSGWPRKERIDSRLQQYWRVSGSLTVCEDLLLFNGRIVVPKSLQQETLSKIHDGHQGIERCLVRAKASVWWPGITKQLTQKVQHCEACCKNASPAKEPLMATPLPEYPWQKVGTDLFELKGAHYLLIVDYFSRYPEVTKLVSTTSSAVISALKAAFSRHGIPEVVRSDNGPQYSSHDFAKFAETYGFKHLTSSPVFPQSNGQAERAVGTVKRMLERSSDPFIALLSYRSTPLPWCDLSPAELSMGRKIRSTVPQTNKQLVPKWPYLAEFRRKNQGFKTKQKQNFDARHRVRNAPAIPDDAEVWVNTGQEPIQGRVTSAFGLPRSYVVQTPTGEIRRNRSHLNIVPPSNGDTGAGNSHDVPSNGDAGAGSSSPESYSPLVPRPSPQQQSPRSSRIPTRSYTGTTLHPPDYLRF